MDPWRALKLQFRFKILHYNISALISNFFGFDFEFSNHRFISSNVSTSVFYIRLITKLVKHLLSLDSNGRKSILFSVAIW